MERSFVKAGKSLEHEMRHRIAMCSNTEDLENAFSVMSGKMIEKVIGEGASSMPLRDIRLTAAGSHYSISDKLEGQQLFREAWYCSDLPSMIERFAMTAWHRYLHIQHSSSRANIKIRF